MLLLGILVAATGFTVLTGTAETQRLQIVGTVNKTYRAQYDILVRPKGSTTDLERSSGLVRANYLSGIHGGITLDQFERIKSVNGIEVAAPIGVIGYTTGRGVAEIPVTDVLHKGDRTLLRIDHTRVSDRGLTRMPYPPEYEYVTRRPMKFSMGEGNLLDLTTETLASGKGIVLGKSLAWPPPAKPGPFPIHWGPSASAWSTRSGAGGNMPSRWGGTEPGHARVEVAQDFPFLLAAIDPKAEAELAGLDTAMVDGRYLAPFKPTAHGEIPLLAAARPYVDQRDEVTISRLPVEAAEKVVSGMPGPSFEKYLAEQGGTVVKKVQVEAQQVYENMLDTWQHPVDTGKVREFIPLTRYWTAGPVGYGQAKGGALVPRPVANPAKVWEDPTMSRFTGGSAFVSAPIGSADTQFRPLDLRSVDLQGGPGDLFSMRIVGRFDAEKLPGFSPLSTLPMETYNPPAAAPGDDRTRSLLKGRNLLPNDNLAGYLQAPPLLLTDLPSLRKITGTAGGEQAKAPLSTVRVRVAGVTGPDPVSRERISQVARDIVSATGLDVDITMGSSPSPVTVDLPAGAYGRPALTLREGWVEKGVAYKILKAADRKSVLLFILILAVCGLFVVNTASASVRTGRAELGVLSCLGWSRLKLFGTVLAEVGVVGLLAGVLSAGLALPLSSFFGLQVSVAGALLAVPAALALALSAGLFPAWRASTVAPAEAVRPAVRAARRARSPRGVTGMALAGLTRVPGRTLLGVTTLLVCVLALTVLLGVTYGFRGRVIGSLLGDAIVVQARPADYAAIAVMFALGTLAVADVLYIGVRERDGELAALRATGWRGRSLARLVVSEGMAIGVLGGVSGACAGILAASALSGELSGAVVAGALAASAVAVVLAMLASALPALVVQRLPLVRILARE
ncbi:MAG: hypothetical protein JWQ95_1175 [Sphaerisporangium sp.]|nr:hypothetical protein [Sphaerisporangium sp.]